MGLLHPHGLEGLGEDVNSVVQNPGFNNPAYPADDYTLPKGVPGSGIRGVRREPGRPVESRYQPSPGCGDVSNQDLQSRDGLLSLEVVTEHDNARLKRCGSPSVRQFAVCRSWWEKGIRRTCIY
jgi:hypothetical protein